MTIILSCYLSLMDYGNLAHQAPEGKPPQRPPRSNAASAANSAAPSAHHSPQRPPVAVPPAGVPVGGGLFTSLKGGAGNFLKNLKDTSSKVMATVQQ